MRRARPGAKVEEEITTANQTSRAPLLLYLSPITNIYYRPFIPICPTRQAFGGHDGICMQSTELARRNIPNAVRTRGKQAGKKSWKIAHPQDRGSPRMFSPLSDSFLLDTACHDSARQVEFVRLVEFLTRPAEWSPPRSTFDVLASELPTRRVLSRHSRLVIGQTPRQAVSRHSKPFDRLMRCPVSSPPFLPR